MTASSCSTAESRAAYEAQRRARLLQIYPVRTTTRTERRIGKKIPLADHYYGSDGLLSLCYRWFYFDSRGRLLDTEWQWSSD